MVAVERSVLVIGAGAAGLSCAHTLLSAGVSVTVLEASARVGGRCFTVKNLNGVHGPCELGATWHHGVEGNPAYELSHSLGLLPTRPAQGEKKHWRAPALCLRSDGVPVDERDVQAVQEVSRVLHDAVDEVESGAGGAPSYANLGEHVRGAWRAAKPDLLNRHGTSSLPLLDAAWRAAEKHQCAVDGCGDLSEEDCGEAYRVFDDFDGRDVPSRPALGGFSAAMEALAKPLRERGALRLECPAALVRWRAGHRLDEGQGQGQGQGEGQGQGQGQGHGHGQGQGQGKGQGQGQGQGRAGARFRVAPGDRLC